MILLTTLTYKFTNFFLFKLSYDFGFNAQGQWDGTKKFYKVYRERLESRFKEAPWKVLSILDWNHSHCGNDTSFLLIPTYLNSDTSYVEILGEDLFFWITVITRRLPSCGPRNALGFDFDLIC